MKAARLHAYGDADQFKYEDVPTPAPSVGEVLVKVEASSLNPVEHYLRQGYIQQMFPLELPAILGVDVAGTVASVGSGVAGFAVGDRVLAKLPINGKGAQAEFAIATVAQLARLPDGVSFETGATLPLVGLTGRQGVDALGIKPGERVLVSGALGAVGRAAVQYLKELGATPVAGVRAERLEEGRKLAGGAIALGSGEKQFDKALDAAGGEAAGHAVKLVRNGGKLAAIAGVPDDANADNRIAIIGVLGTENAATLDAIAKAAAKGELNIPVARTLKLAQVAEAYALLGAGKVGGKIILVP